MTIIIWLREEYCAHGKFVLDDLSASVRKSFQFFWYFIWGQFLFGIFNDETRPAPLLLDFTFALVDSACVDAALMSVLMIILFD